MSQQPKPQPDHIPDDQGSGGRSPIKDDLVKRALQKEPMREEPRIDGFDPDEVGTGTGRSSAGDAPAR